MATVIDAVLREDLDYLKHRGYFSKPFIDVPINHLHDTLIISAIKHDKSKLIKTLLSHNANLNIQNVMGKTAFHVAIAKSCTGDNEYLKLFKQFFDQNKIDPFVQDNEGNTIFHLLAKNNSSISTELFSQLAYTYPKLKTIRNVKLEIAGDIVATRNDKIKIEIYLRHDYEYHSDYYVMLYRAIDLCSIPLIKAVYCGYKKTTSCDDSMFCDDQKRTYIKRYKPLLYALRYRVLDPNIIKYMITHMNIILDLHDDQGNCALHYASQYNMCELVDVILNEGADRTCRNRFSFTPIHFAALNNNIRMIKQLCLSDRTIRTITQENADHDTVLTIAIRKKNKEIVRFLLQIHLIKGYLWTTKDVKKNLKNICQLLVPSFLRHRIALPPNKSDCPVHDLKFLISYATKQIMKYNSAKELCPCCLIENELDLKTINSRKDSLLYRCFKDGFYQFSMELINQDVDLNHQDVLGFTFLHLAVESHQEVFVKVALDRNVDLTLRNSDGKTALQLAFELSFHSAVDLILNEMVIRVSTDCVEEREENIATKDNENHGNVLDNDDCLLSKGNNGTAACKAAVPLLPFTDDKPRENILKKPVEKFQSNPSTHTSQKDKCHKTLGKQNLEKSQSNPSTHTSYQLSSRVKHQLEKLYFNFVDINGDFILQSAIKSYDGSAECYKNIEKLMTMQININRTNIQGKTPLSLAVQLDQLKLATLLEQLGADISILDEFGCSAVDYAMQHNLKLVLVLLGDNLDYRDSMGNSLLHIAVLQNKSEMVTGLIRCGMDVTSINDFGDTPLHLCAQVSTQIKIAELLVKNGASLETVNAFGNTALHTCLKQINLTLAQFFLDNGASLFALNHDGETPISYIIASRDHSIVRQFCDVLNIDQCVESEKYNCPVCFELPKAVYKCRNGHHVCGDCITKPNMENCPICRTPFRDDYCMRNEEMENEIMDLICMKIQSLESNFDQWNKEKHSTVV